MSVRRLAGILALLVLTSCYRTHYANFSPENPNRSPVTTAGTPVSPRSGWQHFFLWGWIPAWRKIDAREICGSAENVDSIRTRRTFLEGLVAAFAGYYVNVYSPWDGAVYCREAPR